MINRQMIINCIKAVLVTSLLMIALDKIVVQFSFIAALIPMAKAKDMGTI